MRVSQKSGVLAVVGVFLIVCALVLGDGGRVQGEQQETKTGDDPHYSVVETQGHNLLVIDNATNTLYFYTTDKDAKIGDNLKLRASVDLTQVGKPEIRIKGTK